MAEVQEYALVYHYGDSFEGSWTWKDSAGAARDITNYRADLKVEDENGTTVLHLSTDTGAGLQILTGTDGKVTMSATAAIMLAGQLVEGVTYSYDIRVESSDSSIKRTLSKGPFRVDISRNA